MPLTVLCGFLQMLMLGMTASTPGLQKSCVAGQWMQSKFAGHRNVFAVLNGLMYECSGRAATAHVLVAYPPCLCLQCGSIKFHNRPSSKIS